jgi:hypothetical protein
MDWFFALEAPTQVAIVAVLSAIVTAVGAVGVAHVQRAKTGPGTGKAEIAALTIDSTAVHQVAAALEAMNVVMTEHNMILREQLVCLREQSAAVKHMADQVDRAREEMRVQMARRNAP